MGDVTHPDEEINSRTLDAAGGPGRSAVIGLDGKVYLQGKAKDAIRRSILALRKQGMSTRAIAEELGVSQSRVARVVKGR